MYESEIVLPRRVVPQPSPGIADGGDCGACVLAGLLGIDVAAAYAVRERDHGKPFAYPTMVEALHEADARNLIDRLITDTPHWYLWEGKMPWGIPSWHRSDAWFAWVRMGLDAGYYAVGQIDMDGRGPVVGQLNHWVLICGARSYWIEVGGGCKRGEREVLVSCSARAPGGKWHNVDAFLRDCGGYNVLLARPATAT